MAKTSVSRRKEKKEPPWDPPEAAHPVGLPQSLAAELIGRALEKLFRKWDAFVDVAWWWGFRRTAGFKAASRLFNKFLSGTKHQVHTTSYDAWIDIWLDMIQAVLWWSIHTEPEIMDEFLGEMVQEALSYAIQTSMGGTLQTILNTYRGASPYPPDSTSQIGRILDLLDKRLASHAVASAGFSLPVAGVDLLFGVTQELDDRLTDLREQVTRMTEDWNDAVMLIPRVAYTVVRSALLDAINAERELAERYARVKERIAETHLARANEYLDTLEGYKKWYEAGFIDDDTLERLCIQLRLEVEASLAAYDEAVNALNEAYEEAVKEVDRYRRLAVKRVYEFLAMMRQIYDAFVKQAALVAEGELKSAVGHLWETIDGVASYRNMPSPVFYRVVKPVREFKPPVTAELKYGYTTPAVVGVTEKGKPTTPQIEAVTEKGKYTAPRVVATTEKGKYTTPQVVAMEEKGKYTTPSTGT